MAFVFEHVTCLGLPAMSLTAPSGNQLNQESCSLEEKTGEEPFPAHYFNQQWQLWHRTTLQTARDSEESPERC